MEPTRERITVKYLFEDKQALDRLLDVHEMLATHESVADLSDEPADPRTASLTIDSQLGFWGIDAYPDEGRPMISVSANNHVFDGETTVNAPNFSRFLEHVTEIHELLSPAFAYGVELYDMTEPPLADTDLSTATLEFVPWLTVFTPAQVDTVGRETLLSTPAPHVDAVSNGCVLLVTHHPHAMAVDDEIASHLGIPSAFEFDRDRGVI